MNKHYFFGLILLLFCITAYAQTDKIPTDPNVRIGHLANGLTYYIRHNDKPSKRCEFHIAQKVGAILEEDDQNGLAHFLEHMAFNGTTHFPDKEIINYFERQGVAFGKDINAYTSLDETVYRLSNVPTTRSGIIDSALLVLLDWSCGISLKEEEIEAERGVIFEEWRTGNGVKRRFWKKTRQQMFAPSQYSKRDVIGDTAIINHFKPEALRAYYKKWYGPDNQAIIVVGDINVDSLEKKIKQLWDSVPQRKNRGERPIYTAELNSVPQLVFVTDSEANQTAISLNYLYDQPDENTKASPLHYREGLKHWLLSLVLSSRLADIALQPNAPILQGRCYNGEMVKLKDAFVASCIAKTGSEIGAYQLLLTEMEKAKRYGILASELERQKKHILSTLAKQYNERDKRDNIAYAREYIGNFTKGEPIPGIEWEYDFIKTALSQITLDDLNKLIQDRIHPRPIIVYNGNHDPKVEAMMQKNALQMLVEMSEQSIAMPKDEVPQNQLVSKLPKKGKIKASSFDKTVGCTIWEMKNGVRVYIKPTQNKQDEIVMLAFSKGGLGYIEKADLPSAIVATSIMESMGLGQFGPAKMKKILADKELNLQAKINDNSEIIKGVTTIKDFDVLLQMVYLSATATRIDNEAYKTKMTALRQEVNLKNNNPKTHFYETLAQLITNHSDRTIILDTKTLDKVSLEKVVEVYRQRFSNLADFSFFFVGNIDPNDPQIQKQICLWLGGVKTNATASENILDRGIRAPKSDVGQTIYSKMKTPTTTFQYRLVAYGLPYSLSTVLNARILARILARRYLETMREKMGGSYSVSCKEAVTPYPEPCVSLIIQYDTDPSKQPAMQKQMRREITAIKFNGILTEELKKEKETLLKQYRDGLQNNGTILAYMQTFFIHHIDYFTDFEQHLNAITEQSVQDLLKYLDEKGCQIELTLHPDTEIPDINAKQ